MITLETGVPGAGKTLYCIDKLLRPMVGLTVKHENEAGEVVDVPRTIYTNINGLLLDHEKIGPGAPWKFDQKSGWTQPPGGDLKGLNNWHEWAKPGALIVYDEVQKPWPLAAAGSAVPPCIEALETHRHMGVDFIVLTQHPMLIHANLVRLIGRHLHVRRMGNMGLAIVYEWDSASKTLLYKNALAKAPYRYNKKVFDLYKSAVVHTKMPRRIPALVWGVLFGLLAIGVFLPVSFSRVSERISPSPKPKATASAPKAVAVVPATLPPAIPASVPGGTGPGFVGPVQPPAGGCGLIRDVCQCYDGQGVKVDRARALCLADLAPLAGVPSASLAPLEALQDPVAPMVHQADLDMIAWTKDHRKATHR